MSGIPQDNFCLIIFSPSVNGPYFPDFLVYFVLLLLAKHLGYYVLNDC